MTAADRETLTALDAEEPGVLAWAEAGDRAPLPPLAVTEQAA